MTDGFFRVPRISNHDNIGRRRWRLHHGVTQTTNFSFGRLRSLSSSVLHCSPASVAAEVWWVHLRQRDKLGVVKRESAKVAVYVSTYQVTLDHDAQASAHLAVMDVLALHLSRRQWIPGRNFGLAVDWALLSEIILSSRKVEGSSFRSLAKRSLHYNDPSTTMSLES
jgi:hypothetical protein